ncbi:MAG: ATP-binding protein [Pseudomonadota bacterium]|nr:ATP-binding protein [Pseudomonadota bacterium]
MARHPVTYVLSLGAYAGVGALLSSLSFATAHGYNFLFYYLGISAAFLLAPIFLQPYARIAHSHQLNSLPDMLAFRYQSSLTGVLATLVLVTATIPIIGLQFRGVAEVFRWGTGSGPQNAFGVGLFALLIGLFTLGFAAHRVSTERKHDGMVAAIAASSVVKLLGFVALGTGSIYWIFGGWTGLDAWLQSNPEALISLHKPLGESSTRVLLLVFFASAVLAPHMYQMTFTEARSDQQLKLASWALPLYLLALALPVLPIVWAAATLDLSLPALLSGKLNETAPPPTPPLMWVLVLLIVLAGAASVTIASCTSLATMALNHLLLPYYQPRGNRPLHHWIARARRIAILTALLAGYACASLMPDWSTLSTLALASNVAALQLLPGTLGVLYWPGATRLGFVVGLLAGLAVWGLGLLLPTAGGEPGLLAPAGAFWRGDEGWSVTALASLFANVCAFGLVSMASERSPQEKSAAEICSVDNIRRPQRRELAQPTPEHFIIQLSRALGAENARIEVQDALDALQLSMEERRPYALRRLRDRIEANLSGQMGPTAAREIVQRVLPYKESSFAYDSEDINFIENRLETVRSDLRGLAAELDGLRRYHRQTLQDLPIGVVSVGIDGEVLMWNRVMEQLTGITASWVIGSQIRTLPEPWGPLLTQFLEGQHGHLHKQQIHFDHRDHWLTLHQSVVAENPSHQMGHRVLLVEDMTENQRLERQLMHSERLASIGRLAAGVAHEIGNPVTGIDGLAQTLAAETHEAELLQLAEQIRQQVGRISRIVQTLVNFAHQGRPTGSDAGHVLVDVAEPVAEAVALLSLAGGDQGAAFDNQCQRDLYVRGDSQQLQQVFVNLLDNARDASPADQPIRIESWTTGTDVRVSIIDRGDGIPKSLQDRVFDPFFTTKEPGRGTGLGLAVAYHIVLEHGGDLEVTSPWGSGRTMGTKVTVRLPKWVESAQ